jgi:dipeptidyl aminopeptidase/acylaminoacyl peptidase
MIPRRKIVPVFAVLTLAAPAAVNAQSPSPSDLESAVTAMAKVGAAWSPSFSPRGDRIAFVTRLSGIPQLWTVATQGGWPDQVTAFDDPVDGVAWSPDGAWLAVAVSPGGGENGQIYLVRPDGSGLRRITDGGKESNWLSGWNRDGRLLTLASNRRGRDAMDAYVYDVERGQLRMVAENAGIGLLTDVSHDGKRAVLWRMKSRGDANLFLVDVERRTEALLTPHEGPGNFDAGLFSHDGRTVFLSSDKDRDLVAFARVQIDATGRPGPIEILAARDDAELEGFAVTKDGTTAALLWNVAGRNELAFMDLVTRQVTRGPELPAEVAGELTFSKDGQFLALSASGAAAPRDIFVIERSSGRTWQVTRSPHPGVNLSTLVRPELVRYTAHDGLPLTAWLYRPLGRSGPGAIVLSFHGGPEGQERPVFNSNYQALLARGIAVLAPNVRGSSGFGKRFVNLDNGALRANGVRDIKASVDYVVRAGVADAKRIGIMGGSYGGYMVMAGLADYPESFAAGANLFGVVNFETFFANTEPWMAAISTVEYGDPKTQAGMLRELSPIHRVDRVRTPTIVLHGANDTNVPVVEAEQVVNSLKRRGVPVEYILFPDEGHGWRKTLNRVRSTVAIVRWFEKHLQGSSISAK